MKVSIEELRNLLSYNPETGELVWKRRDGCEGWNTKFAGRPALASKGAKGYLRGAVQNQTYLAHRVAWAIFHGRWPSGEIDHINGIRHDNRIENLRDVSCTENHRNMKRFEKVSSLPAGVSIMGGRYKFRKYRAKITVNGRSQTIGYFSSAEEAHSAYLSEAQRLGFSPRHGVSP